jgi:hypothetical protein
LLPSTSNFQTVCSTNTRLEETLLPNPGDNLLIGRLFTKFFFKYRKLAILDMFHGISNNIAGRLLPFEKAANKI